jgi:AcrR family transcriptional regulator
MARVTTAEREATRERLIGAAGREFRLHGFGGAGVDAVAKDAGVTSGAVYAHFGSKLGLFRETVAVGLGQLQAGLALSREKYGARWLRRFATWYLNAERRADLGSSCALPSLTLEAARADDDTRDAYTDELRSVIKEMQAGLPGGRREADAIAILALLSGGMTMAHAVSDEKLGARIAKAIADAVAAIGEPESGAAA